MNSLLHEIEIGNLKLASNIFLAPLAGYTDRIYRSLCLENGADLAYTEMVSAEGAYRNGEGTLELMERGQGEKNLAVQLFMPDAETAERSVENVLKYKPDLVDINCGCPVPKVVKTGAGSALMKKPQEIKRIVETLVKNLNAGKNTGRSPNEQIPVTVKIRTGWDTSNLNYLECAEAAFSGGAQAVCMHARSRSQLYMPTAHWQYLKDLKKHFTEKTIIGSGDLFAAEDGVRMFEETGVDAIAYARGAIGNPFIFRQTKQLLTGKEPDEITTQQKVQMIIKHLDGLCTIMPEIRACREMRKHVCAYLKGIPNGSRVKNLVSTANTKEDYQKALNLLIPTI